MNEAVSTGGCHLAHLQSRVFILHLVHFCNSTSLPFYFLLSAIGGALKRPPPIVFCSSMPLNPDKPSWDLSGIAQPRLNSTKASKREPGSLINGADGRNRTVDLLITNQKDISIDQHG